MTDRILIRNLLLRTRIGVNSEERRNLQDVILNITLHADTRAAGASDDIDYTVNYRTITKEVIDHVETSRYYLVEKLANEIARLCLSHEGVLGVTVRVEKPGALRFAESAGVEITRTQEDFVE